MTSNSYIRGCCICGANEAMAVHLLYLLFFFHFSSHQVIDLLYIFYALTKVHIIQPLLTRLGQMKFMFLALKYCNLLHLVRPVMGGSVVSGLIVALVLAPFVAICIIIFLYIR